MIFKSPHAPVSIPELSITDYVLSRTDDFGDKPALVDGPTGRVYTYRQLPRIINKLAAGLASHGLSKGDVFAIYAPNLPEYLLAFHAVASLGAVTTMVPTLFAGEEIATQLRDSGAKFLLTIPRLMPTAIEVAKATGIQKIFVIGETEGAVSFESLISNASQAQAPTPIASMEDLAVLPYSSGTTGLPKGVMLTHRNLVAMLRQIEVGGSLSEDDTMICVVPMYHLYGLHVVANQGLSQGATIVTLPRYDLNQFLETLERYKVTVAPLVPPLVLALSHASQIDDHDLSALRMVHCGAATLADSVAQACKARLGCEIRYGYGLTEVSPLSHTSLADPSTHRPGSVGYCLPNTECKIVAYDTGAELDTNQEGEICVRGPQIMKGYLGNPEATAQMIDAEGWLRSGDVGYCDSEGRLFVVDRIKELIKTNGRQVAPAELEAILLLHEAIADAAVIPAADESAGEVPKAFVVLQADAEQRGHEIVQEIMTFVAGRVAPYKRLRSVELVAEIPKSPAGKILRRVLIERERREAS